MTEMTPRAFKENAHEALNDASLQRALANMRVGFIEKRLKATKRLPEFDDLRDNARQIKNHVLAHLDLYLEAFERKVIGQGGHVHWARNTQEAQEIVLEICKAAGAKTVTKGKSMIGEEVHINPFLEEHGIEPIETDLGEYIIQLRHETPSHIIAPAIHVNRDEVETAFRAHHTELPEDRSLTDRAELLSEARSMLRDRFVKADVGITGANFLIAETGSSVIVTNEGNGDLTQSLPRVHIALASLEKVVPTLEDATTIMRVLARSATGQEMSVYTTVSTGPRRPDDVDGPEEYHVILLDNGRSRLIGTEWQEILRCIRCGACLNHCPVYGVVGGHAYGTVYPGPMGKVLSPALVGLAEAHHLPNASSFCGRCEEVCPMHIPLPKMMRHWREAEHKRKLNPLRTRWALAWWARVARMPRLYRFGTRRAMAWLGRRGAKSGGRLTKVPFGAGWTNGRDLPAPQGETFMTQWRRRQADKEKAGKGKAGNEKAGAGGSA